MVRVGTDNLNGRLAIPGVGACGDQSSITRHAMLQCDIKIRPHAPKDGPNRRPEEKNFLISLVEEVVNTRIELHLLVEIIGGGEVPNIKGWERLIITGIVKSLSNKSAFQVDPKRLDRLIAEYG